MAIKQLEINKLNGLDLRTNPILMQPNVARNSKNVSYSNDGYWEKRKGFKTISKTAPGYGVAYYKRLNPITGAEENHVVGVDVTGDLKKEETTSLLITYVGVDTSVLCSLYYDDTIGVAQFVFQYGATKINLGTGKEGGPVTIATLKTAIDALGDYTASTTGDDTVPAAFLNLTREHQIVGAPLTLTAKYWSAVHQPDGSVQKIFFSTAACYAQDDNENASFVKQNQSLYMADGGFLAKFDGLAVYRAGMPYYNCDPSGTISKSNAVATGLTSSAVYQYLTEYQFTDANGLTVRGPSIIRSVTMGVADDTTTQTFNYLPKTTNFPCFGAVANGQQDFNEDGSITVTVDAGHNLIVGMHAMFKFDLWEGDLSVWLENYSYYLGKITSVAATAITLQVTTGAHSIRLKDNAIISAVLNPLNTQIGFLGTSIYDVTKNAPQIGLRIAIYRTEANGSIFYYLTSIYNDPVGTTVSFVDSLPDTGLNDEYSALDFSPEMPRAGKYISAWAGQLIMAGRPLYSTIALIKAVLLPNVPATVADRYYDEINICQKHDVYWTDRLGDEGFPIAGVHEISLDNSKDDDISGLCPNRDSFFAFKRRSIALLSGEIGQNNIAFDFLKSDSGCECHASIQEVEGDLVYLDAVKGFMTVVAGGLPKQIGKSINSLIKDNAVSGATRLLLRKAIAVNFEIDDQYICYIPANTEAYSKICVLDYSDVDEQVIAWHIWQDINMRGGAYVRSDVLYFIERGSANYQWQQSRTGTQYDYQDHTTAIEWFNQLAWINFGVPSLDKFFNDIIIHHPKQINDFTLLINQYCNYIDTSRANDILSIAFSTEYKRLSQFNCLQEELLSTSFRFTNSQSNKNVAIAGVTLSYSLGNSEHSK